MALTVARIVRGRRAQAWASLFFASIAADSTAQVVLDGKFGAPGPVAGPNFAITPEMGSIRGNNLFHSFQKFDLQSGDVATFSGPANVQNILSRVTGGAPSSINGTIRSEIAGANFFLINPSGVIFGASATVDVSGSFAVSSANYLRLADGARFVAALDADDSALSTAPVSAFGFLNGNPGSVTIQQSALVGSAGQTVSIVGGEIAMDGGLVQAAGGQVNLVAVKSAGEVPMDPASLNRAEFMAAFPEQGRITVANGARVDAGGDGGGRIVIRGGSLVADNSRIEANTFGAGEGRGIDVAVAGELALLNVGQITSLSPAGTGRGGDITVAAESIRMDGGGLMDENFGPAAQISTVTGDLFFGGGPARGGDIFVQARAIDIVNSGQISAATFGEGDAGNVNIQSTSIRLDSMLVAPAQIAANSQQLFGVGGKAGEIHIKTDTLDVLNGALIISTTAGTGAAGLIDIEAGAVRLLSAGIITAGTFGAGEGGSIKLKADSLTIDGRDLLMGGPDFLTGIQAITSSPQDLAPGGNIQITADSIELKNNGSVYTTSSGLGKGGDIEIIAGGLTLDNRSTIHAAGDAEGAAGEISISTTGNILLTGKSGIVTSAPNSSGGDIVVNGGTEIHLQDSEINAQAGLNGGNITIAAPDLIYLLDSKLTAQADTASSGFGNGGNLTIGPGAFFIMNNGALVSKSSLGNGGNISILTDNFLKSTGIIDATAPFGLPGTVSVTAPDVDLTGILVGLTENLFDAETQLRPDCAVRLAGNISSFIVLGRGGLPIQPGGFLPSGMALELDEAK